MTTTVAYQSHSPSAVVPGWISNLSVPIFVRAFIVALILGSALTAINQSQAVFGQTAFEILPLVLVFITPFAVVTFSQLLGIRQALRDGKALPAAERFLNTVKSHGIPSKAVGTGLVVGTVNTGITAAAALLASSSLAEIPLLLIAQAYLLPVLFGLLSQAISYRRAKARLARAHS